MPDKPLTVLTYAASASLAAAALVYFFNPNHMLDGEAAGSSASTRKKGVIGLANPANDCFINSILQALAGLRELRLYLIRELHRRALADAATYTTLPPPDGGRRAQPQARKLLSLQAGEVTRGLKDMLDRLNEKPIHKKTISASAFIAVLEHAFGTRISKSQQDAQELLQVVAERVSDEYHAGKAARKRAREAAQPPLVAEDEEEGEGEPQPEEKDVGLGLTEETALPPPSLVTEAAVALAEQEEEEGGFPLEGRTQSEIECQTCHFVPKSAPSSFVMLTLAVPQKNNATLNECFDQHFKTEYIDDYKCDRCRLSHAHGLLTAQLAGAAAASPGRAALAAKLAAVDAALADPENPPAGLDLPAGPTRRIARHVRLVDFPAVLVVHLSRSIYDAHASSTKNTARVSFPERLPLGGLVHRRTYRLLGVVCHKGTHNSGHYETFRRQHVYAPTSTPHRGPDAGPYSRSGTPAPSSLPSPQLHPRPSPAAGLSPSAAAAAASASGLSLAESPSARTSTASPGTLSSPSPPSAPATPSSAPASPGPASGAATPNPDRPASPPRLAAGISLRRAVAPPPATSFDEAKRGDLDTAGRAAAGAAGAALGTGARDRGRLRGRRGGPGRWWRISDEKIKECRTADVLAMQKEVYILFYEIEKDD